jgi:hypothetical protein
MRSLGQINFSFGQWVGACLRAPWRSEGITLDRMFLVEGRLACKSRSLRLVVFAKRGCLSGREVREDDLLAVEAALVLLSLITFEWCGGT